MIIVSLFGGLGNQMFQYATAKAIAFKLGVELKLDVSLLQDRSPRKNFTYRDYELNVFCLNEDIATIKEVRKYVPDLWNSPKIVHAFYHLKRKLYRSHYYFEKKKYLIESDVFNIKDNTYIYGYFQSEKYFTDYSSELLDTFSFVSGINKENKDLIGQIEKNNSVSIHIRRGDFVNSPFQLLQLETYYLPAIEAIQQKATDLTFYIFTNDHEWASEQFRNVNIKKIFVDINNNSMSYMDMILMSHCNHNICANSSFSWWGAWLNRHPDKIVYVPKNWFKTNEVEIERCDLIPNDWIII
ncbi:MAG: alpha-1,2-fucosyltransferase [Paludibacter sp.]|nr:alpha-1,2-fucosyltransferase [Paludibacter sp.]